MSCLARKNRRGKVELFLRKWDCICREGSKGFESDTYFTEFDRSLLNKVMV